MLQECVKALIFCLSLCLNGCLGLHTEPIQDFLLYPMLNISLNRQNLRLCSEKQKNKPEIEEDDWHMR